MARIETWFEQDLQELVAVRMLTGNLFSLDNQGNLIGVKVFDGGTPATLSGTVSGNVILPNGGTVAVTGTLSGNQAYIILPQAAYVPGVITIAIKLTSSGVITTLAAVSAVVYRTSTDTTVDPGTIIPSIQTLINQINTAVASIPADYSSLWTTLAPAFSTSTAYTAGQYVTYSGAMYRFTKAHAAGSWASGDVTAVNIGAELTDLKSAIMMDVNTQNSVDDVIYNQETELSFVWINGHINGTTGQDSGGSKNQRVVSYIPIYGNQFKVRSTNSSVTVYLYEYDAGFNFLGVNGTSGTAYIAPVNSGTKFVRISTYSASVSQSDLHTYVKAYIVNDKNIKDLTDLVYHNDKVLHDFGSARSADTTVANYSIDSVTGLSKSDSSSQLRKYAVTAGDIVKIVTDGLFQFQTVAAVPGSGTSNRVGITYRAGTYILEVPATATYLIIAVNAQTGVSNIYDGKEKITPISNQIKNPVIASADIIWRNGSAFNTGNSDYICPVNIIPRMNANKIVFFADIDIDTGDKVRFRLCTFSIESGVTANSGNYRIRNDIEIKSGSKVAVYDLYDNEKGFIIYITKENSSGTIIPLRVANVTESKLKINRFYADPGNREPTNIINMSRHIPGSGTVKPLTLLHFSDPHADTAAVNRILMKASTYSDLIDGMICTGDITENTYGSISGWWNPNVMTCIGNHDTAKYENGSYDWTYLTMAQRDQYYIAPFESNWGITHTSGTSYYYKDYADSKVRLIVLDGMLYTNPGEDAVTQTAWLGTTMDGAKALDYHVLIAIHAPHGGAEAVDCTFSKRGGGTRPVYADCNTPQDVIEVVASKIEAGCKFVGYLCGHAHQDNIWDCENDGKQLMYCVTCAAVSNRNQWKNSDQYRDENMDAFNIVTIDTVNGLVKIIRCGGANADMNMRNRKQICFYYPDGIIFGQDS